METVKGQASIFIEVEDGNITVTHGTDKVVLLEKKNAVLGSWDEIWETLRNIKTI